MKQKHWLNVVSAFFALAVSSSAAVFNITVDSTGSFLQNGTEPDGALSLASNEFYSSFQDPASTANNRDNNFNFLEGVIANWNANRVPTLGAAVDGSTADDVNSIAAGTSSFTTAAGYDYVVFHFGTGEAGAGGGPNNDDENGWWSAWYLGGDSATFSLPQEGNPLENVGGFSSARYFNGTSTNVPDGGSTFFAFGIGLLGLGGVRRFLLKA